MTVFKVWTKDVYPTPKSVGPSEKNRDDARDTAKLLRGAFTWSDNAYGHDYWEKVYDRLYDIVKDGIEGIDTSPDEEDVTYLRLIDQHGDPTLVVVDPETGNRVLSGSIMAVTPKGSLRLCDHIASDVGFRITGGANGKVKVV